MSRRRKPNSATPAEAAASAAVAAVREIRRSGGRVIFEDGTSIPLATRPKPRVREADDDVSSLFEDLLDLVNHPESYALAPLLEHGATGGRPYLFPPQLYSLLHALTRLFPHAREMTREIKKNATYSAVVWAGVLARIDDPDERARIQTELVDKGRFPSRTTIRRAFNKLDAAEVRDAMRAHAVAVAIENDYFNADRQGASTTPDRRDSVYNDGTVHKALSAAAEEQVMDPATAELWKRRVDHDCVEHTEGGGKRVVGMKSVQLMVRGDEYGDALFLDIDVERSPAPAAESRRAVDMFELVDDELARIDGRAPSVAGSASHQDAHTGHHAIAGFAIDGAANGPDHQRLLARGTVLASPVTAKSVIVDPATGDETRIDHVNDLGNWDHHKHDGCPGHRLVAINSRIHLQETINGKVAHTRLDHRLKITWRNSRRYLYIELAVPCRRHRTTDTIRISLRRATYAKRDTNGNDRLDLYDTLTTWVRAWPGDSVEGKAMKALRVSVEGTHSRLDDAWDNGRVPAWGNHMRHIVILGWARGDNLLADMRLARRRALEPDRARAG